MYPHPLLHITVYMWVTAGKSIDLTHRAGLVYNSTWSLLPKQSAVSRAAEMAMLMEAQAITGIVALEMFEFGRSNCQSRVVRRGGHAHLSHQSDDHFELFAY